MNINDEISLFLDYLKNVKNRSESTIRSYSSDLREFSSVLSFRHSSSEVTRDDIESQYTQNLVQSGNSASSRSRKLSAIRSFFKFCVSHGYVVDNPVEFVESPKLPKKKAKVMSEEQICSVIELAESKSKGTKNHEFFRNFCLISVLFSTGIRRSELINIKLKDLSLSKNSMIVHGKGSKDRVVYFNEKTKNAIESYINCCRNKFICSKKSEYLFVSQRSEKMSVESVNLIVNKYFNEVGIKSDGFTVHSTRKAFATMVYEKTGDIFAVQNLLGHSSPNTTIRYVGVNEEKKKQAAMTVSF